MNASDLDEKEQKHVRIALRLLRRHMGGWHAVSRALRFQPDSLEKITNGRKAVTASLAFRFARFVQSSIDDLLAGKYAPHGTCPNCGKVPDFANDDTIAE